jgi:subtilisin family serine protease
LSPRLYSIISFKSALLGCFLLCGCLSDVSTTGSSSSSSNGACPGEGGLFPTPVAPQSFGKYQKFTVSQNKLRKNETLVALVNEKCLALQLPNAPGISQLLRNEIMAQTSRISERAYDLKLSQNQSLNELKQMAENDPCLVSLGDDVEVTLSETTVNDPQFASQTHLAAINAPQAWDVFYQNLSSTEVIVAIIDDGTDMTHQDLSSIHWVNPGEIPGNGIDDDGNGYVDDINGYNFASNIASPAQQAGTSHGTHVAGLAAAMDNNSIGVSGVMGRNVKIMSLNVFGSTGGAGVTEMVNALNYARSKGAHVINMSLGGLGSSDLVKTALENAVAGGSFIAIAAGNDDSLITSTNFYIPMGYAKDIAGAVAVGSVDAITLQRSSFSNYSTTYVEIGAPGSDDTVGGLLSTVPTNSYGFKQGTSMASPVVAGAAALLIGWAQSQSITLSPAQVESYLKSSADVSGALSPYFMGGALLNLSNLASSTLCF